MVRTTFIAASFCLMAVGGPALAAPASAPADRMDVAAERVSLAGLDLTSAAGQRAGMARLLHATVRVCADEIGLTAYGRCQSESAARAATRFSALVSGKANG
jgi:UrcA family protein